MSFGRISWIAVSGAVLVAAGAAGMWEFQQERSETLQRAASLTGGDPHAGEEAVVRYGCGSCHTIPGLTQAHGMVGPPLGGFAGRVYVAGVLSNTPDNVMGWVKDPQGIDPQTAMPNTGVTDADARDIAAFLYTLK